MPLYGYNYPWSGRIGRFPKCIFCGSSGPHFRISSAPYCMGEGCAAKRKAMNNQPDPVVLAEQKAWYEVHARKWCDENGLDYDATIANYEKNLGPHLQERDGPIPGCEKDFAVVKDQALYDKFKQEYPKAKECEHYQESLAARVAFWIFLIILPIVLLGSLFYVGFYTWLHNTAQWQHLLMRLGIMMLSLSLGGMIVTGGWTLWLKSQINSGQK